VNAACGVQVAVGGRLSKPHFGLLGRQHQRQPRLHVQQVAGDRRLCSRCSALPNTIAVAIVLVGCTCRWNTDQILEGQPIGAIPGVLVRAVVEQVAIVVIRQRRCACVRHLVRRVVGVVRHRRRATVQRDALLCENALMRNG